MRQLALAIVLLVLLGALAGPAWAHHKPWVWWLVYGPTLPWHLVGGPFGKVMDCVNVAERFNAMGKTKLYRCILDSDHW